VLNEDLLFSAFLFFHFSADLSSIRRRKETGMCFDGLVKSAL